MTDTIGINHKLFKDFQEEKKRKASDAKQHIEAHMFDRDAQLQRQKDTFDKHIDDSKRALTQAIDKINESNVEKMDLQKLTDSYIVKDELTEKLKYMRLGKKKVHDQ